jgi:hypothetical protein
LSSAKISESGSIASSVRLSTFVRNAELRDAPLLLACVREQSCLMPPDVREWLPEDSPRLVRARRGGGDQLAMA